MAMMEVLLKINISNSSDDPIYMQIKNQLKAEILTGRLEVDAQLPSIRFLAKELRVSVITTKRAYDDLESEGFIHSVQGKGSFVAPQNASLLREENLKLLEGHVRQVLYYARLAGLTIPEVKEYLDLVEEDNE